MVIHRQTTYVTFCSECDTGPKLTNFPKGEPVRYFEENLEAERLYINLIQKATEVLHSFFDSTTIFYSKHTTKTVEIMGHKCKRTSYYLFIQAAKLSHHLKPMLLVLYKFNASKCFEFAHLIHIYFYNSYKSSIFGKRISPNAIVS